MSAVTMVVIAVMLELFVILSTNSSLTLPRSVTKAVLAEDTHQLEDNLMNSGSAANRNNAKIDCPKGRTCCTSDKGVSGTCPLSDVSNLHLTVDIV